MKLFFKMFLFCLFICVQFLSLDSAFAAKFRENDLNNSGILDGNAREKGTLPSDVILLSDGNAKGTKYGEHDVLLSGNGPINLTMTSSELEFEVCNCAGTSSVCYKSLDGFGNSFAAGSCSDSTSCEFKARESGDAIYFGRIPILKNSFTGCLQTSMKYPNADVKENTKHLGIFESCTRKMVDDNIIELYILIDPYCSIIVKNAKVHVPKTPQSTNLTTNVPPKHSPEDSTEASFPWWGFLIIGIVLLIVVGVIGFIIYRLYKKHQTSKRVSQKADETKPLKRVSQKADETKPLKRVPQKADETKPSATVSKADIAADVKTPTKKHDDLKAVKVEKTQMPKKDKKKTTKTEEPKTTDDLPASNVSKQELSAPPSKEPALTEQQPTPTPKAAHNPLVKRLIPRGMKSAKTDSLDETLKKDKCAMIVSLVDSAGKNCLKSDETDISDEMKSNYPNIQHEVLASEVKLLSLPVSEMYAEMNLLARESEEKLSSAGCEFDGYHRIISVSKRARRLLKDKATNATTVYFAFGAEYHKYITDGSEASIPLLYAIALQPRFSEASRRRACATLRRNLVKVLGWYKAADRAKMPFPINIVENAYCLDPKYFYDPAGIKTDSGSDGKKKRMDDVKRKKKSLKRH